MTEEKVRALFELANIPVERLHRLENNYWPNTPDYYEVRAKHPWWLVGTEFGVIEIGWRKRVININWGACDYRDEQITPDDVTKSHTNVHAWGYAKAVEYLTSLRRKLAEARV